MINAPTRIQKNTRSSPPWIWASRKALSTLSLDKTNTGHFCVHRHEHESDFLQCKSRRASPIYFIVLQFPLPFKAGSLFYSPSNHHVSVKFNRDPSGIICFRTIQMFFCGFIDSHCVKLWVIGLAFCVGGLLSFVSWCEPS